MKFPSVALSEKKHFSERLKEALRLNDIHPKPSVLTRKFNVLMASAPVTAHAVRKWLAGESIPTQEKILVLAKWLNVSAAWLRFGDADTQELTDASQVDEVDETAIFQEVLDLTKPSQKVVKDLVKSLKQLETVVIPHKIKRR